MVKNGIDGEDLTDMGIVADLLSSDEMREALARPRPVPRAVREYLAEIVLGELATGENYASRAPAQAARQLGPLFNIYLAARQTDEWAELRRMASVSPGIALICARHAIIALLDAFEEAATQIDGGPPPQDIAAFLWLIRDALRLWGRRPDDGRKPAHSPESPEVVRLMSDLVQKTYVPRIRPFLDEMAGGADAIEFLTLLYPGRMWDRGMAELHQENAGNIRLYSDIASRSGALRQVLDLIGQASEAEAPGKSRSIEQGRSEMYSVINSKDLQYILPSELVKLRDRTLKYLFLARWAEGKLLTYQLKGRSRSRHGLQHRKGPVVAMVDTSGSMSGSPGQLAKSIVLASVRRALTAGRDMRVVLFASTGQTETIDLAGRHKNAAALLEFLRYTFGGGTDFDTALRSGIDALKDDRYGGADLLFITDGLAKITDEQLLLEWGRFKAVNRAQIFTIIIGNDCAGGLEGISDRTFILEAGPGPEGDMKLTAL